MERIDTGPPEIRSHEIALGKELGRGAFGLVYEGTCRAIPVAIKVPKLVNMNSERVALFRQEIATMSQIFHPNICLFLGACTEDPKNIKIVTEKLEGDLQTLVRKNDPPISVFERLKLAHGAARGMAWLHGMGCLHRDLKTPNILYDKNKVSKVCDFGLAHFVEPEEPFLDEENKPRGTPLYMAPEVLANKPVTKKVDVYAFGIVMWELLTGKAPFSHHNKMKTFSHAICVLRERPPLDALPAGTPESCKKLMVRCWDQDPNERPDFEEIVPELASVMIDSAIADKEASFFWKVNYNTKEGPEEVITWERFIKKLYAFMNHPLPEGNDHELLLMNCLKEVFVDPNNNSVVSIHNFGHLLDWYGPLTKSPALLHKIHRYLSAELGGAEADQFFFYGNISQEKAENLLRNKPPGTFLLRFSRTPGSFAISRSISSGGKTAVDNLRITYSHGKYSLPGNLENEDLIALIKQAAPAIGLRYAVTSPFQHLFVQASRLGYGTTVAASDEFSFKN
eukprot:TRINITY_DN7225_c0_g1_i1.p1 TRINITY_DN7225_c0_g1~~TRINITY_DN7225_c0_g1_i1.p1  ORF type:complete len:535 (-),score=119.92 TRINITY_DN7225_c0_g1_i1:47-1573(-)